MILPRRPPEEIAAPRRLSLPDEIIAGARQIVDRVRAGGLEAVADCARRYDGLEDDSSLVLDHAALAAALDHAPDEARGRLERIAGRIRRFARAQRECLAPLEIDVPGGRAGHEFVPLERAGCYAPGGRYPLPSSVLMTVIPALVAGVDAVWVASPNPRPMTLWAAAVAGADGLLATGGAQAVAALAYGAGPVPAADIVVGPGNLWVTAAKQLVAADVAIDMAAGPSELVVIADGQADPLIIAADLQAQAEHDPLALPMLLTTDERLVGAVEAALADRLATLPTADTARRALAHGGAVVCRDEEEICRLADRLAPEHLELHVADQDSWRRRLGHWGALFVGAGMGEVFGDYGIGPNHVLPTGGAARRSGGLSVLTFLRLRTWLQGGGAVDPGVIEDTAWLARQEGLEAHARAAEARRGGLTPSK